MLTSCCPGRTGETVGTDRVSSLLSDCSCPTLSTSPRVSGGSPWTASLCSTTRPRRPCSTPARCTRRHPPPTTASTSAACSATAPCCGPSPTTPAAGPSPSPTSRWPLRHHGDTITITRETIPLNPSSKNWMTNDHLAIVTASCVTTHTHHQNQKP